MEENHLIILWEKARYKQEQIIQDISKHFVIRKCYDNLWSADLVSSNFSRFYGQKLPPNSFKEVECGTGRFLMIILTDLHPVYEVRNTNDGDCLVNTNLFDLKHKYRKWTGGGHKVHATNNPTEFNHDITLLLGKNSKDVTKEFQDKWDGETEVIQRDIVGAKNWSSTKELFYVLNSTVNYVILRGYKELLYDRFTDAHRDIDLLVEDSKDIEYILNGRRHAPAIYRPHVVLEIQSKVYYIDLWQKWKDYFDCNWVDDMLRSREEYKGLYKLSAQNDAYCLLYHCLLFKGEISNDYKDFLLSYFETKEEELPKTLISFLDEKRYGVLQPKDRSVRLQLKGELAEYIKARGVLIKTLKKNCDGELFISRVFEKEKTFIKRGTNNFITRERCYLEILKDYKQFPTLLEYLYSASESQIEISRINGVPFDVFFSEKRNNTLDNIRDFIIQSLNLIQTLSSKQIIHRDYTPQNIFVKSNNQLEVYLIDFGWAISQDEVDSCCCPENLTGKYRPQQGFSDLHTMASFILECWGNLSFVRNVCDLLYTTKTNYCLNKYEFDNLNKKVMAELYGRLSFSDIYSLLLYRYEKFCMIDNLCKWNTIKQKAGHLIEKIKNVL
ncbi:MAG: protein kinase [Prevotella sp.]|nr:protein kinase [Prevotella sp.]